MGYGFPPVPQPAPDARDHPHRAFANRWQRGAGRNTDPGALKDFESDPSKLWSTNIFGKSLNELVNEGLQAKLMHMPAEARTRLQQTLERIINDGCDGLICILL